MFSLLCHQGYFCGSLRSTGIEECLAQPCPRRLLSSTCTYNGEKASPPSVSKPSCGHWNRFLESLGVILIMGYINSCTVRRRALSICNHEVGTVTPPPCIRNQRLSEVRWRALGCTWVQALLQQCFGTCGSGLAFIIRRTLCDRSKLPHLQDRASLFPEIPRFLFMEGTMLLFWEEWLGTILEVPEGGTVIKYQFLGGRHSSFSK